jgi:DNA polymerase-4
MRVREGKRLVPDLIVLPPDPDKYRYIHLHLRQVLGRYTDRVTAKSIDEFALNLAGCPALRDGLVATAGEIKRRVRTEVGDWLRVSIGIGPSRWLAKQAAGLVKPDGLETIDRNNYRDVYRRWALTDLTGINVRLAARLHAAGLHTVIDLAAAPSWRLRSAFASILGHQWYLRLRGWEADDVEFPRRSFGAHYSIPRPLTTPDALAPILTKLAAQAAGRMRRAGYHCYGVQVAVEYRDGNAWHRTQRAPRALADTREIGRLAYLILCRSPYRGAVRSLAVVCAALVAAATAQGSLFEADDRRARLAAAVDEINARYGRHTVAPAAMLSARENVPDRISFGSVADLLLEAG